jgi:hypothetical protein
MSYLDLRFRAQPGVTARIVERPARHLSDAAVAALVTDLQTVARTVLGDAPLDYGAISGDRERLSDSVLTILYDASGRPIAFNALAWMDLALRGRPTSVLHLGLVMVDPAVRSQGLSWVLYGLTCFLLFARGGLRPIWISNVTQVPAVVGMVAETFSAVFPNVTGAPRSHDHLALARAIMRRYRHVFGVGPEAGFDEARFVITDAYTGGSDNLKKRFADAARHRVDGYNALCEAMLDYERGDDLLQLGRIDLETARAFVRDAVPRESVAGVLAQSALLALQALVLPVWHWLDAGRDWGSLRPAR